MKRADIKVGEHYVYRTGQWGSSLEIEVLEFVTPTDLFDRRSKRNIRVRFTRSGYEALAKARNIQMTWVEYERLNAEIDARMKQQEIENERQREEFEAKRTRVAELLGAPVEMLRSNGDYTSVRVTLDVLLTSFARDPMFRMREKD